MNTSGITMYQVVDASEIEKEMGKEVRRRERRYAVEDDDSSEISIEDLVRQAPSGHGRSAKLLKKAKNSYKPNKNDIIVLDMRCSLEGDVSFRSKYHGNNNAHYYLGYGYNHPV